MNEPQVWTLIGVFAAGLFGMLTIMSTMFVRIIRTEIGGLRSEIRGDMNELRAEIRGDVNELRAEVKGDIASLRGDIRTLDRDVNSLMKNTFGIDRD